MTKTVIEMAREAGFETEITGIGEVVLVCNFQGSETDVTKELGRFAALVREDEREKLKQQLSKPDYMVDAPVVHPLKAEVVMTFKQQEPVAWALMHKNGLELNSGYGLRETLQEAEDMQRRHLGNLKIVPLYTTPPTAAIRARGEK